MKKIIAAAALALSFNANADFSDVVLAYSSGKVPVTTSIDLDAEYVAMSISLVSEAKFASQRVNLINQLEYEISEAASKDVNIEFQQGVVSLSPGEKTTVELSSNYATKSSGSQMYLLYKLDEYKDIYAATQEIYQFINRIKKPDETKLHLSNTLIAIKSPNDYRNQLLSMIKDEINITREILGNEYRVTVKGLQNPVRVKQKDHKKVTLYIDYQLEFNE
ncbi:hypothetical protein [Motilimonas pumila]|uniref:DUF541 domain-containing protein n=1 Tax=Motilimonas pumila TaxID=2303987 RepID=A0A418YD15_9GAMM|nr:hypothetical protein [Motilimonas pumila]RJG42425.1 hypothetical protein D1Z90_13205 [Motilimonas pumila]